VQQGIDRSSISGHLGRCQVRIAPHHLCRLPAAHFLQVVQRRAMLNQPAGPGVAQVVPAEVGDPGAYQGAAPTARVGPVDRLSLVRDVKRPSTVGLAIDSIGSVYGSSRNRELLSELTDLSDPWCGAGPGWLPGTCFRTGITCFWIAVLHSLQFHRRTRTTGCQVVATATVSGGGNM
jgi:hypothetical protein